MLVEINLAKQMVEASKFQDKKAFQDALAYPVELIVSQFQSLLMHQTGVLTDQEFSAIVDQELIMLSS